MIEIVPATSPEHFAEFQELVNELMAWDTKMASELGQNVETILTFLYDKPAAGLAAEYASNGAVFLARCDGRIAGCGALKKLSENDAGLTRVYVRPEFRGKGLGKALVEAIILRAREIGYATLRLQTAIFMKDAQAMYRSFGFQPTSPFRSMPDDLKAADVFMELRLRDA